MNDEKQVWLNGKFIPWASATVPILSHSFSRASGIFEIFRIHTGPEGPAAFRMEDHLKRLLNSARLLDMQMSYSMVEIAQAVAQTVTRNDVGNGVVKIMAYWSEEAVIQLLPQLKPDSVEPSATKPSVPIMIPMSNPRATASFLVRYAFR